VVDQLQPHVHVEPCRRVGKEAVGVGCDVEFADGGDEGWFEVGWIEGAEIDAWKGLVLLFPSNMKACFCDDIMWS
jgi:hypothetical protein